jgi:hypothetical protein
MQIFNQISSLDSSEKASLDSSEKASLSRNYAAGLRLFPTPRELRHARSGSTFSSHDTIPYNQGLPNKKRIQASFF